MQDLMASNRFGILLCHFYSANLQVPGSSGSDTLTCLTLHSKASKVIDAAICWNYMVLLNSLAFWTFCEMYNLEVVAEPDAITKYGLINNRPGQVIKSNSSFTIFPRNTLLTCSLFEGQPGKTTRRCNSLSGLWNPSPHPLCD